MKSCSLCVNISPQGQISNLLTPIEINENNLHWYQWTLEQSLKQHASLIINLFPRVWRLFVIFVCSWIFDQDTKSQKFGLFLGLVFLLGIGHIHIWSRSDNGTAPVVSGLGVQCGVWFCFLKIYALVPLGFLLIPQLQFSLLPFRATSWCHIHRSQEGFFGFIVERASLYWS